MEQELRLPELPPEEGLPDFIDSLDLEEKKMVADLFRKSASRFAKYAKYCRLVESLARCGIANEE